MKSINTSLTLKKALAVLLYCNLVLLVQKGYSQLLDINRAQPYQQVFVQTDAFDSSYLTQLETIYRSQIPDTLKLAAGNDLAYYWHTRNLLKANQFAYELLALAKSTQQVLWEGRIQITLGAILLRQEKLDSAEWVLNEAKTKLQKKEWPMLLTNLGYVFERRGQLSRAADYAHQGLQLGDSLNDLKTKALAYSDLSNLFWKQAKFDKGTEYGLISEALFKQRGIQDMDYSFTLYVIGNSYLSLKDYPNAQRYFKAALAQSERFQFYNNLADIQIALAELYTITGDYTKAVNHAKEAIRYSALLNNNFMLMRSWLQVGKLQNLNNQPEAAISSLKTCLQIATEKFGDNFFLNQAYKQLGKAYAATGDYLNAYAAFEKYDVLKDSVFTAEADQRVARLQTEFEVAKKENTITAQQQLLAQQRKLQWLMLGAAALLLFTLIFVFRNYQNKRKLSATLEALNESLAAKNLQLDKQNAEKELLLKEIHHRVKNNLEIVSGLLALQAAKADSSAAQAVMQASQNRVLSMGIIHQKLYQRDNLAAIEMKDYFENLGEGILDTFNAAGQVVISCPMNPIELDVDTAVPVGLIANELLTNALKYAFPENTAGIIQMVLKKTDEKGGLLFSVSDNGKGKPQKATAEGTGFGTELINLLVQQLNGSISIKNDNGTTINIYFTHTKTHHGQPD